MRHSCTACRGLSWFVALEVEMAIAREEFLELLTRADMTYAQLGSRINRHERTVSNWGGKKNGGVPDRYEAVVRDALAVGASPGNPLAAYSDYALLDELARRLRRSHDSITDEQWINADPEKLG